MPMLPRRPQMTNPIPYRDINFPTRQWKWIDGKERKPNDDVTSGGNDHVADHDMENTSRDLTTITRPEPTTTFCHPIQEHTDKTITLNT